MGSKGTLFTPGSLIIHLFKSVSPMLPMPLVTPNAPFIRAHFSVLTMTPLDFFTRSRSFLLYKSCLCVRTLTMSPSRNKMAPTFPAFAIKHISRVKTHVTAEQPLHLLCDRSSSDSTRSLSVFEKELLKAAATCFRVGVARS